MRENELKPCPFCGGEVNTMCSITKKIQIFVRCRECKKEYNLPEVKLKTWPTNPIRISRTTIKKATEAWNRRINEQKQS